MTPPQAWSMMLTMASVAILLLALVSPSHKAAATPPVRREAVVVRTVENLYSAPGFDKDVTSQAYLGQVVTILETRGPFAKIETPDRYQGWTPASALKPYASRTTPRYAAKGRVAEVVSLVALVYREPDVTTYRPKAKAPLGARLELVKEAADGRWHRVRLPDGEEGFIQKGDVVLRVALEKPARASGPDLVATARRLLGVPYLWGGMTPLGVDCSGFVSLVYRVHGQVIPRDADLQFDDPESAPVERDHLAAGDLLFFGRKTITHVGMYMEDGRFISATTYETPVVREDRLDDPHWVELYKGARRPK